MQKLFIGTIRINIVKVPYEFLQPLRKLTEAYHRFERTMWALNSAILSIAVYALAEIIGLPAFMSFYYQDRVMPYYAGSLHDFRHLAPNDFMYWELMRRSCERGCKVFDFGRSKQGTGSFAFKEHWGFEPCQLAYQYRLNTATALPDLSPANPKYRKKIELWRKLPFVLTKLVGPPLAKYLA